MADEEDVLRPGKILWILGAGQHETLLRPEPGRFDEQRLERRLPVARIGPEIGQVGPEPLDARRRPVNLRVDMAIERDRHAGAETAPQLVQRDTARVAENQIEVAQATRPQYRPG